MTTPHRLANVLTWLLIAWAFIWICLFGFPGIYDHLSHRQNEWAKQTTDLPSEKVSDSD